MMLIALLLHAIYYIAKFFVKLILFLIGISFVILDGLNIILELSYMMNDSLEFYQYIEFIFHVVGVIFGVVILLAIFKKSKETYLS